MALARTTGRRLPAAAWAVLVAAGLGVLAGALPARGATVTATTTPADDGTVTVTGTTPFTAFAVTTTEPFLEVEEGPTPPDLHKRAVMEFDISGIPAGASIIAADVTLTRPGGPPDFGTVSVHSFGGDGSVTTTDADTASTTHTLLLSFVDSDATTTTVSFTSSTLVTFLQGLVDGGIPFAGLVLSSPETTTTTTSTVGYVSLEGVAPPVLSVEFYTHTLAAGGGAWSATTTWKGGLVPGPGDDVLIPAGAASSTVDTATTTNSVTLNPDFADTVTQLADLTLTDDLALDGGTYVLASGTLDVATLSGTATFTFTGGRLNADLIDRDLAVTGGTLAPGDSPSTTVITGVLTMDTTSTLEIEIASPGVTAGTDFDFVDVQGTGTSTLDGTVSVLLLGGFTPGASSTFDVVEAGEISLGGTFTVTSTTTTFSGAVIAAAAADGDDVLRLFVAPDPPDLQAGSDTGTLSTDDITSSTTPTFDIVAAAGGTITLSVDGGVVATTSTQTSPGVYTAAPTGALLEGTHAITANVTLAGVDSPTSTLLTVTIDTTAVASAPDLTAASDTFGATGSDTDNITSSTTPTFTVTTTETIAGGTISLFKGGAPLGSSAVESPTGTFAVTVTSTLSTDGTFAITAVLTDVAGNVSVSSAELSVTIDTAADVSAPDLTTASDTGSSSTDNITSSTTPTFTVTTTETIAGGTITLFAGGVDVTGAQSESPTGTFAVTSTALGAGTSTITAMLTDVAGNVSPTSTALSVTIDTTAAAPDTPDLVAASDTGLSDTDNLTGDLTPTFTVTAEAGGTVELFKNGSTTGLTDTAAGTGTATYTITVTSGITDGDTATFTAKVTDVAGNLSSASTGLTVTFASSTVAVTIISVSTTTIDFGDVQLTTASSTSFTITNTDTATALTINAIDVFGAGFSRTSAVTTTIAAGGSHTVDIQFLPTSRGAVTGLVVIDSDDAVNPLLVVDLAGTGVALTASDPGQEPDAEVVAGDAGVEVQRFDLLPDAEAAQLETVVVTVTGTLANLTRADLVVDVDGDGTPNDAVLTTTSTFSGGAATFAGLAALTPTSTMAVATTTRLFVLLTVTSTPASNGTYKTTIEADGITATGVSSTVALAVSGLPLSGRTLTLKGKITAANDAGALSTPELVAADKTDVEVQRFTLLATETEKVDVSSLTFTATGSATSSVAEARLIRTPGSSAVIVRSVLAPFATGTTALTFSSLSETIGTTTATYAVVLDFDGTGAGGDAVSTTLSAMTATGADSHASVEKVGLSAAGDRTVKLFGSLTASDPGQLSAVEVTAGATTTVQSIELTAANEDVTISELHFDLTGTGSTANLALARLLRDTTEVSTTSTFSSADFTGFTETIGAGTTATFTLELTFIAAPTGNGTYSSSVTSSAGIVATGASSGEALTTAGLPLSGRTLTLKGEITAANDAGALSTPELVAADKTDVEVQRITLVATETEKVDVSSLTFTATGSATSSVAEARLIRTPGSSAVIVRSVLAPFATGTTALTFSSLSETIGTTTATYAVVFDFDGTGAGGDAVSTTLSAMTATGADSHASVEKVGLSAAGDRTVKLFGSLTASDPGQLSAVEVTAGTATTVQSIELTAANEAVDVTEFHFELAGTGSTANLALARLLRDTTEVSTTSTFSSADFTGFTETITAGTTATFTLELTFVASPAGDGTYSSSVTSSAGIVATGFSSAVALTTTGLPLSGRTLTLKGKITAANDAGVLSTLKVAAADETNVEVQRFTLLATATEKVDVSSLTFTATGSATSSVKEARLIRGIGSVIVRSVSTPFATGTTTLTFSSLSERIDTTTTTFRVVLDFDGTGAGGDAVSTTLSAMTATGADSGASVEKVGLSAAGDRTVELFGSLTASDPGQLSDANIDVDSPTAILQAVRLTAANEDVIVSELHFTLTNTSNIASARLLRDGSPVTGAVTSTFTGGTADFTGLTETVSTTASSTFTLVLTFSGGIGTDAVYSSSLPATGGVTATGTASSVALTTAGLPLAGRTVTLVSGAAIALDFTSSPITLTAGDDPGATQNLVFRLRDANLNTATSTSDVTATVTTTSPGGRFGTGHSGPFVQTSIALLIPAGQSSATFFYKDSNTGAPTLTVTATSTLAADTQTELVEAPGAGITVVGTIRDADGAPVAQAGTVVSVFVDDAGTRQGTTDASGDFAVSGVSTSTLLMTVFIDNGLDFGTTVTRHDGTATLTVDITQDALTLRNDEVAATGLTTTDLKTADNIGGNARFQVSGTNLSLNGLSLRIPSGHKYTADLAGTIRVPVDFTNEGTFDADKATTIFLGGDLVGSSTFTIAATTVLELNGTATQTVSSTVGFTGTNKLGALRINKSSGVAKLGSAVELGGGLTLSAGDLETNEELLTVGGNVAINGGSLTANTTSSKTLSVGGNWSLLAGATFDAASSTVEMKGADKEIGGTQDTTFFGLAIAATTTLARDSEIRDVLAIADGVTLAPGANTVTLSKSNGTPLALTGSGDIVAGSSKVIFSGSTTTIASTEYFNLEIGATASTTDGGSVTVAGVLSGAGSLTLTGTTTLSLSGSGDVLTLASVAHAGATTSTVEYTGASAIVALQPYEDLTVGSGTSAGSYALEGSVTGSVANDLTIRAQATLRFGAFDVDLGGSFKSSGTVTADATSTLTMKGADKDLGPTGTGGNLGEVVITASTTTTLQGDVITTGQVTVEAGATLDLNDKRLTLQASGQGSSRPLLLATTTSTLVTGSSSTVDYAATTASTTVTELAYQNLTISGAGQVFTLEGALASGDSIGGDLRVEAGATLDTDSASSFDLEVDATATIGGTLLANQSNVRVNGVVQVAGAFETSGSAAKTIALKGTSVTVAGRLALTSNKTLVLGDTAAATALTVTSGGTFEAKGATAPAVITSASSAHRYTFVVKAGAGIDAQNATFEFMDDGGIQIDNAASVVGATSNQLTSLGLKSCTFREPDAGTASRLLFFGANANVLALPKITFDSGAATPSAGQAPFSVAAPVGLAATLNFFDAKGDLGDDSHDSDPGVGGDTDSTDTVSQGKLLWGTSQPAVITGFETFDNPTEASTAFDGAISRVRCLFQTTSGALPANLATFNPQGFTVLDGTTVVATGVRLRDTGTSSVVTAGNVFEVDVELDVSVAGTATKTVKYDAGVGVGKNTAGTLFGTVTLASADKAGPVIVKAVYELGSDVKITDDFLTLTFSEDIDQSVVTSTSTPTSALAVAGFLDLTGASFAAGTSADQLVVNDPAKPPASPQENSLQVLGGKFQDLGANLSPAGADVFVLQAAVAAFRVTVVKTGLVAGEETVVTITAEDASGGAIPSFRPRFDLLLESTGTIQPSSSGDNIVFGGNALIVDVVQTATTTATATTTDSGSLTAGANDAILRFDFDSEDNTSRTFDGTGKLTFTVSNSKVERAGDQDLTDPRAVTLTVTEASTAITGNTATTGSDLTWSPGNPVLAGIALPPEELNQGVRSRSFDEAVSLAAGTTVLPTQTAGTPYPVDVFVFDSFFNVVAGDQLPGSFTADVVSPTTDPNADAVASGLQTATTSPAAATRSFESIVARFDQQITLQLAGAGGIAPILSHSFRTDPDFGDKFIVLALPGESFFAGIQATTTPDGTEVPNLDPSTGVVRGTINEGVRFGQSAPIFIEARLIDRFGNRNFNPTNAGDFADNVLVTSDELLVNDVSTTVAATAFDQQGAPEANVTVTGFFSGLSTIATGTRAFATSTVCRIRQGTNEQLAQVVALAADGSSVTFDRLEIDFTASTTAITITALRADPAPDASVAAIGQRFGTLLSAEGAAQSFGVVPADLKVQLDSIFDATVDLANLVSANQIASELQLGVRGAGAQDFQRLSFRARSVPKFQQYVLVNGQVAAGTDTRTVQAQNATGDPAGALKLLAADQPFAFNATFFSQADIPSLIASTSTSPQHALRQGQGFVSVSVPTADNEDALRSILGFAGPQNGLVKVLRSHPFQVTAQQFRLLEVTVEDSDRNGAIDQAKLRFELPFDPSTLPDASRFSLLFSQNGVDFAPAVASVLNVPGAGFSKTLVVQFPDAQIPTTGIGRFDANGVLQESFVSFVVAASTRFRPVIEGQVLETTVDIGPDVVDAADTLPKLTDGAPPVLVSQSVLTDTEGRTIGLRLDFSEAIRFRGGRAVAIGGIIDAPDALTIAQNDQLTVSLSDGTTTTQATVSFQISRTRAEDIASDLESLLNTAFGAGAPAVAFERAVDGPGRFVIQGGLGAGTTVQVLPSPQNDAADTLGFGSGLPGSLAPPLGKEEIGGTNTTTPELEDFFVRSSLGEDLVDPSRPIIVQDNSLFIPTLPTAAAASGGAAAGAGDLLAFYIRDNFSGSFLTDVVRQGDTQNDPRIVTNVAGMPLAGLATDGNVSGEIIRLRDVTDSLNDGEISVSPGLVELDIFTSLFAENELSTGTTSLQLFVDALPATSGALLFPDLAGGSSFGADPSTDVFGGTLTRSSKVRFVARAESGTTPYELRYRVKLDPKALRRNLFTDSSGMIERTFKITVLNIAPLADPSLDLADPTLDLVVNRNGTVPVTVQLDGSRSRDPNGEDLAATGAFSWTVTTPSGTSPVELSGIKPSFQTTELGAHLVKLVVTDSKGASSEPRSVVVTVIDSGLASSAGLAPAADAGLPVVARLGDTVALDARASTDPEAPTSTAGLTFTWETLDEKGNVVGQKLGLPNTGRPTFQIQEPGATTFRLTVSKDGRTSPPAMVQVLAVDSDEFLPDARPVRLEPDPNTTAVRVDDEVFLSGSATRDTDAVIAFTWRQTGGLPVSFVVSGDIMRFVPVLADTYVFEVTATDQLGNVSPPVTIAVPVFNRVVAGGVTGAGPVVFAGNDLVSASPGQVTLTGAVTSSGATLFGVRWRQTAGPPVVLAENLTDPTRPELTFTPPVSATYELELVAAFEDGFTTLSDRVRVLASLDGDPPVATAIASLSGSQIVVQDDGSEPAETIELQYVQTQGVRNVLVPSDPPRGSVVTFDVPVSGDTYAFQLFVFDPNRGLRSLPAELAPLTPPVVMADTSSGDGGGGGCALSAGGGASGLAAPLVLLVSVLLLLRRRRRGMGLAVRRLRALGVIAVAVVALSGCAPLWAPIILAAASGGGGGAPDLTATELVVTRIQAPTTASVDPSTELLRMDGPIRYAVVNAGDRIAAAGVTVDLFLSKSKEVDGTAVRFRTDVLPEEVPIGGAFVFESVNDPATDLPVTGQDAKTQLKPGSHNLIARVNLSLDGKAPLQAEFDTDNNTTVFVGKVEVATPTTTPTVGPDFTISELMPPTSAITGEQSLLRLVLRHLPPPSGAASSSVALSSTSTAKVTLYLTEKEVIDASAVAIGSKNLDIPPGPGDRELAFLVPVLWPGASELPGVILPARRNVIARFDAPPEEAAGNGENNLRLGGTFVRLYDSAILDEVTGQLLPDTNEGNQPVPLSGTDFRPAFGSNLAIGGQQLLRFAVPAGPAGVDARAQLIVRVRSGFFDPIVDLIGPDGNSQLVSDDNVGGKDSFLYAGIDVNPNVAAYFLLVSAAQANVGGLFTITVSLNQREIGELDRPTPFVVGDILGSPFDVAGNPVPGTYDGKAGQVLPIEFEFDANNEVELLFEIPFRSLATLTIPRGSKGTDLLLDETKLSLVGFAEGGQVFDLTVVPRFGSGAVDLVSATDPTAPVLLEAATYVLVLNALIQPDPGEAFRLNLNATFERKAPTE